MSCVLEWEQLAEIAQRASGESVGADAGTNNHNLQLVFEITAKIARRIGCNVVSRVVESHEYYDE